MGVNWEQKLAAIQAIAGEFSSGVMMRRPGDWYVSADMEHALGDGMLIGDYGNGTTPEQAVGAHWKLYGNGQPFKKGDSWFRWNGFMWEKSERPQP